MTYTLLAVFAAFCATVGAILGNNQVSIWGVLGFLLVGLAALQLGYVIALLSMTSK